MERRKAKLFVVALGGSIICPQQVDWEFLKRFKRFVERWCRAGARFVIVAGGGRVSRIYQHAAGRVVRVANDDKDWIGIHATRLNAHLLRTVLRAHADPVVIDRRHRLRRLSFPITIASGWRPGWSTDYVAVQLAADFRAREVIIAGKPDYVYDKDCHLHGDARPFPRLRWREYRALIPPRWIPGSHVPVDPIASRLAERERVRVAVICGRDLRNFSRLLRGQKFRGTIIE